MSRSRRKLDTSPIEYDDVVESPALKGMVSFLEVPPGALPRLDFTGQAAVTGTPVPGTPPSGIPEPGIPTLGTPHSGIPETGIPLSALVSTTSTPPEVASPPPARIRRANLAQDGHSFGEQALYDALWQHAQPRDADTRIITIGYRHMAGMARLTVNNCKANIRSLIQKLAVEEIASFTHSQGRTYLVYSYAAILQRRRETGLTHYVKSRGVAFVDPDTGEVLTARPSDKSGIPFSGIPFSGTVPERGEKGIPVSGVSGTPLSGGPPYSQVIRNSFRNTTSTSLPSGEAAPAELIQGLRQIIGFVDQEAAAVLWRQCRRRASDCTPAEVLHFARGKAAVLARGTVQNPTGFLLAAVPKCFEGTGFLEYRQERARLEELEAERARDAEEQIRQMRREFEAILEDPNSSEEDRRFARRMLEES